MTRRAAATVWIVDDDLGFVCWLGDIFHEAGYRVLPATSCPEAAALTERLGLDPDLIVLNPNLPGARGMLQSRVRAKTQPRIVTIGAPPQAFSASVSVHGELERPRGVEPISRSEWLESVRKLLRQKI